LSGFFAVFTCRLNRVAPYVEKSLKRRIMSRVGVLKNSLRNFPGFNMTYLKNKPRHFRVQKILQSKKTASLRFVLIGEYAIVFCGVVFTTIERELVSSKVSVSTSCYSVWIENWVRLSPSKFWSVFLHS